MKSRSWQLLLGLFTFFAFLSIVNAASFNATVSSGTTRVGEKVNVNISVGGMDVPMAGYQGILEYDTSKLKFISSSFSNPNNWYSEYNNSNGKVLAYESGSLTNVITTSRTVLTITFEAIAQCSTTVSLTNIKGSDTTGANINHNGTKATGTITINAPASTNNNLASLAIEGYSINFNANNTSYNLNIPSNITSINVNATVADSKAKSVVSGQNNLKYGSNAIKITVTAENGSQKVYTINVTREDNRSSNNFLKSLNVNGQTLNPVFNKDTTSYKIDVPYAISSLKIDTIPEDSKAKVEISGQHSLAEGKQNKITITVTAENGSKKTYTITVFRGNNPERELSSNNFLKSITVSNGELTPSFSKDTLVYEVWIDFGIETISISVETEDTAAIIEKNEVETLIAGSNNKFSYTIIAEDGSKKEYIVNVKRGKNPEDAADNANNYLKSVALKNGKLTTKFDKNKQVYSYSGKNIEISSNLEDEMASIVEIRNGNYIFLVVTAENGAERIYTFMPKGSKLFPIILLIILLCSLITNIILFIKRRKN